MESPLSDPNSKFNNTLYYIDLCFTIVFTIECILKIIAYGFLINGKYSYILN